VLLDQFALFLALPEACAAHRALLASRIVGRLLNDDQLGDLVGERFLQLVP